MCRQSLITSDPDEVGKRKRGGAASKYIPSLSTLTFLGYMSAYLRRNGGDVCKQLRSSGRGDTSGGHGCGSYFSLTHMQIVY